VSDGGKAAGQVVVITGAGSGIGRVVALALAGKGARLALLDIDGRAAEAVAGEVDGAIAVACDVAEHAQVEGAFALVEERLGGVDVLVNNAIAPVPRSHPEDLELERWEHSLRVNLTGYFLCAQEAGRRMIAAGNGGAIVNVSSINGSSAVGRGNFAYSVTKAGVNQMTRELAIEWAPHRIRVNAVQPCQTRTAKLAEVLDHPDVAAQSVVADMLRGIPLARFAEPEEIAAAVVFLASAQASIITGVLLPVDGGNLAFNAGGTVIW
jgi:NAD(P)-dependent dehydrogenase (short-subunit alcohol dehydrogenase family)